MIVNTHASWQPETWLDSERKTQTHVWLLISHTYTYAHTHTEAQKEPHIPLYAGIPTFEKIKRKNP